MVRSHNSIVQFIFYLRYINSFPHDVIVWWERLLKIYKQVADICFSVKRDIVREELWEGN